MAKARAGKKRRGRKRLAVVEREPNGRVKRVLADDRAREQVAQQRTRYGLKKDDLLDPRAGTAVGRAMLLGHISEMQCEAGEAFARLWVRWATMSGFPMPTTQALNYAQEVRGGWGGSMPSDEEVFSVRARYADIQLVGNAGFSVVRAVAVEEVEYLSLPLAQRVVLRTALSTLVKILRLAPRESGGPDGRHSWRS